MDVIDVLLPTINRLHSLIFTLSGLASQDYTALRVIIAEQSDETAKDSPVVKTFTRIIEARGGMVSWYHRLSRLGIAEQRNFLLEKAHSDAVLFLDDDVFMEPWVLQSLAQILAEEKCGFVGAFPSGLSFRDDVRPDQQVIEFWEEPVKPEVLSPNSAVWNRAQLHRAANAWHLSQKLGKAVPRLYKVAWVASCVLYDRKKLLEVGGFSFWPRLPRFHSGEDVLVQNLLIRKYGACAMLPSGTYHAELPSTVLNNKGCVDGHALELLDEMVAKYLA